MLKKTKQWKCKKYTDWVKQLPSCLSMKPADDPHHVKGILPAGNKVHDLFTIPLTRDEHTELHHIGSGAWEMTYGESQSDNTLRIINRALNEGLIEITWVGD